VVLVLPRVKDLLPLLISNPTVLLLVSLSLLSVLWSVAPEATLRRSVGLLATTLAGLYLAVRFGRGDVLSLVACAFAITLVLSWVFALALPDLGIMSGINEGAWRGVFTHKNTLGIYMLLSTVVFFFLAARSRKYRWLAWMGIGLSIGLLLLSRSMTPLVVGMALIAVFGLTKILRLSPFHSVLGLVLSSILIVLAATAIWMNIDSVLGVIGRDVTLTGRTKLWAEVWDRIQSEFWLGYGYWAFWNAVEGRVNEIPAIYGWKAGSAHNGVLELWLGLGLVGVIVFTLSFLSAFVWALRRVRSTNMHDSHWTLIFLSMFLLLNIPESFLVRHNTLFWVLYVECVVSWALIPLRAVPGSSSRWSRAPGRN
jgi:O-antigen ligase